MMTEEKTHRIFYDFSENPTIQRFSNSAAFIRFLMGPFGSGKSSGCIWDIVKKAKFQAVNPSTGRRRVRWAVVRNTYVQLRDTTLKTVVDWMPPRYCGKLRGGERGPWNYYIDGIKGLEIELMFRALDKPEHVANLLSLELTGAWMNEVREIPKEIFEAVQGRVGRFPSKKEEGCTWSGITGDTNPPDEGTFYHELFEHPQDNMEVFKQPSGLSADAENLKNLKDGRDYYTNLAKGKSKDFIQAYIHGGYGFIQSGEPVAAEYNAELHLSRDPLEVIPRAQGFRFYDGGLTPVCIVGQVSAAGRVYVLKTFVGDHIGMKQLLTLFAKPWIERNMSTVKEWRDIGDPSLVSKDPGDSDISPASVIESMFGANFEPGPVDWDSRLEALRNGLNMMVSGRPFVNICPTEKTLHMSLRGGWHYPKTLDGKAVKETPVKNEHSHPGEAFCYGLARLLGSIKHKDKIEPVKNFKFSGRF